VLVHAASALKLCLARLSQVLDSLLWNGVGHKFWESVWKNGSFNAGIKPWIARPRFALA
jgi:hypothetical protein